MLIPRPPEKTRQPEGTDPLRTNMKTLLTLAAGALLVLPIAAQKPVAKKPVQAAPAAAAKAPSDADIIAQQLPSYPLDTCPISGEKLGSMGDPVDLVVEGRLVRLCCGGCKKKVLADPAAAIAKIDAAVIAQQKASWPLKACPVSGEAYGGDMEPVDYVYGTRYVKFCCKGCIKRFEKDPAKYMEAVDAAYIRAQKPTYPLSVCPISGEELGDDSVDFLYGTQLVRVCCKKCARKVRENPAPVLARIRAAQAKDHGGEHESHDHDGGHAHGR